MALTLQIIGAIVIWYILLAIPINTYRLMRAMKKYARANGFTRDPVSFVQFNGNFSGITASYALISKFLGTQVDIDIPTGVSVSKEAVEIMLKYVVGPRPRTIRIESNRISLFKTSMFLFPVRKFGSLVIAAQLVAAQLSSSKASH